MKPPRLLSIVVTAALLCLTASSCTRPGKPHSTPSSVVGGRHKAGAQHQAGGGGASEVMPPVGPPKQLIIIYSGETLSIPNENQSYTPAEGGLPALVKEIGDYEAQIVDYARMRVMNEGGDASRVRADFTTGM